MKNIQYLFIFILIIVLSTLFCFNLGIVKEGIEGQEEQQTI